MLTLDICLVTTRLIKFITKMQVRTAKCSTGNAGISDDVDYNPYLAKYLENILLVSDSSSLERILLDPGASSQIPKLCYQRAHSRIRFVTGTEIKASGGIGKHHGGAIFFSANY